jgi:hypothetical protein
MFREVAIILVYPNVPGADKFTADEPSEEKVNGAT